MRDQADQPTMEELINTAVTSGEILKLDYEVLIERAEDPDHPLVTVTVDMALPVSSVYQLTGVMQGLNLLGLLPKRLIPDGVIWLTQVSFQLRTKERDIERLSATLSFGEKTESGHQGVAWQLVNINGTKLSAILKTISVTIDEPGNSEKEELKAGATGSIEIASLGLDVSGSYPEGVIHIKQPDGVQVNLGAFFGELGLQPANFLNKLDFKHLDFKVEIPKDSAQFAGELFTKDGDGVTLLPGPEGKPVILALEQSKFVLEHAPGSTDIAICSKLVVLDKLVFKSKVQYNSSGAWDIAGAIDVAASCDKLHDKTAAEVPVITLTDLVQVFAPDYVDEIPSILPNLGIAALSASYVYKDEGSTSYSFYGAFSENFELFGGLTATLIVELSDTANAVKAVFDMDGFLFTLSYDFTSGTTPAEELSALIKIAVGDESVVVSGSYAHEQNLITLKIESDVTLATLITWFVGSVTGKKRFQLADPWHEILQNVKLLPDDLEFEINTETKHVTAKMSVTGVKFFGFSIDHFSLIYQPPTEAGKSGLKLLLKGELPGANTLSWDPATETAPKIPGQGASVLEIRTAAAGQHFTFADSVPDSVEGAVAQVNDALLPENWKGSYPETLRFDQKAGWLFGTHAKIFGQADLQFIFNDPEIYGVVLKVEKSERESKLNVVAGLYATILYRRVTETIGVYEGTLILPDTIRNINFGAFEITLPSFYLAIYTNGDFKIDVGFPYDLDFSNSLSLTVSIYSGSAGFYYAKLDGLDPKGLPQVPSELGEFSPITRIGLGLELGIRKRFQSGPLKAEFAIIVQGLFDGTFATYTRFKDGAQDEFYDMRATVAIFGQLVGVVDFKIIKASLNVKVFIRADARLQSHSPTVLSYEAGVDIALTVTIALGLFKVHIHFSFKMKVTGSESFGNPTTPLWNPTDAHPLLSSTVMKVSPVWQPIAPTGGPRALTAYFIPQLTAGEDYTQAVPSPTPAWFYTGQLALSNPLGAAADGAPLLNANDPSYATFVECALRWVLFAATGQGKEGGEPIDQVVADAATIRSDTIADMLQALADGTVQPDQAVIQEFFKAGFAVNVVKPVTEEKEKNLAVGFFPVLPGMSVSIRGDDGADRVMQQSMPLGSATSDATPVDEVLSDFIVLIVQSGLQMALDTPDLFADGAPTIAKILSAISDEFGSISGLTSRFMLHGTRQSDPNTDAEVPLYALTGQQGMLTAADLAATHITVSLKFSTDAQDLWGVALEGGAETLSMSSADPSPIVIAPADMPSSPQIDDTGVVFGPSPVFDTRPVQFDLVGGISGGETASLWRLPFHLTARLQGAGDAGLDVALFRASDNDPNAKGTQVDPSSFNWALSLDFDISRIPLPGDGGDYLGNTYALDGVNQRGLKLLQSLIDDQGADTPKMKVSGLSLAYPNGGDDNEQLVYTPIDFGNTFLVQANFSTETRPPRRTDIRTRQAAPDPAQVMNFIGKLWSSGVTNSGGYYLYTSGEGGKGLPDTLFSGRAPGRLTLVISLEGIGSPLQSYVNAVVGTDLSVASSYYAAAAGIEQDHALIRPGVLSFDIARPKPVTTGDYNGTLNQIYNLYKARLVGASDTAPLAVFGPTEGTAADEMLRYSHAFTLVETDTDPRVTDDAAILPDSANPYRYVGTAMDVSLRRVDLYGNLWGGFDDGGNIDITYHDPLIQPSRLPYMGFMFTFAAGKTPQLIVKTTFQMPSYIATDGSKAAAEDRKNADLSAYAAAYYQLCDLGKDNPQVTASVITSLVGDVPIAIDAKVLATNLKTAYEAINKVRVSASAEASAKPKMKLIKATIDPAKLNTALLTPLAVAIKISRNGPFAEGIAADSAVRTTKFIVPSMQLARQKGRPASLHDFNESFKEAFKGHERVLAIGGHTAATQSNVRQIWVVRYGKSGINPQIDTGTTPAYFAPHPLSNTLISRDVAAKTLNADGELSKGYDQVATVRDIDLDNEMRKFIAALDALFSPELAIPAALVDADALTDLSASKRAIVEKLVNCVTQLEVSGAEQSGAEDSLAAAVNRYRQECLINLSNFYDMVSVAVVPLVTSLGTTEPGSPMKFFGQPLFGKKGADAKDDPAFSMTSSKAKMDPTGKPMAFGLFAKNKMRQSSFKADLSLQLSAIEFDTESVPIADSTFDAGSWISLVDPVAPLRIGPVNIPIPLRVFPSPPELQALSVTPLTGPKLPDDAADAIALAKSWSLDSAYRHGFVAQDRVDAEVTINIAPTMKTRQTAAGRDLVDELVSFNAVYPKIKEIFVAGDLASIRTPDASDVPKLKQAMLSLAELVGAVATTDWSCDGLQQQAAPETGQGLATRSSRYAIRDGVQKEGNRWRSEVAYAPDAANTLDLLPELQIPGCTTTLVSSTTKTAIYEYHHTESGKPFTEQEGWAVPDRILAVRPVQPGAPFGIALNVIDRQNGQIAMKITRNADLQEQFRYTTDWVSYPSVAVPLIDITAAIDIGSIAGGKRGAPVRLADHMEALLSTIVTGSGTGDEIPGYLQIAVGFEYPIENAGSAALQLSPVVLPVMLQVPTEIKLGPVPTARPAFVTEMSRFIERWLSDNDLSSDKRPDLWARAKIVYDISIFSGGSKACPPILRFQRLELPCQAVQI